MTVQVKAQFTKDDSQFNGLDAVRMDLIANPLTPRVVIAIIEVTNVNHDILSGADTPKVRLRQIEVLDGTPAAKAVDLLNARYSERTGRTDSQASLFDAFDDIADDGRGTDDRSGEEILAERSEAAAAATAAIDEALAANDDAGPPWPGDVEFQAPEGEGTGGGNPPADPPTDEVTARRSRKRGA